jgi:hypothetical protein
VGSSSGMGFWKNLFDSNGSAAITPKKEILALL